MKDDKNFRWTKKDIAEQYKHENPDWSWNECWDKANLIYRELNKINTKMWQSNKTYFKNNKPFSFFDDRNGEFEETYCDWTS